MKQSLIGAVCGTGWFTGWRTVGWVGLLLVLGVAVPAQAAGGGGVRLLDARVDLGDQPSLQRGAKLFVNYCLGCHAASYMRYNRMSKDIGITEDQLRENLLFTGGKVGDQMTAAMDPDDAGKWFGNAPPDLSVISRSRGPDWLYTYLLTFYEDAGRPFGVNNLVFKDVAMPHVLAGLQGAQVRKAVGEHDLGGSKAPRQLLEPASAGSLNPAEYRQVVRDLVNFLVYVGEPAQLDRYRLGFWVLVFIAVFYLISRSLYKEYWKDVH